MKKNILFLFLLFPTIVLAQKPVEKQKLNALEAELNAQREKILNAESDSQRVQANEAFISTLKEALDIPSSFDHPFTNIQKIGNLKSPDNFFRMFTWNLPFDDGTHKYFCFIQIEDKKKGNVIYELQDESSNIENPEYKSLDNEEWYGALYYEIIEIKKGKKKYYTLLGWDGDTEFTNSKVIDVLYFSGSKYKPKFGTPLFKRPGKTARRIVFKYAEDAVMNLKYEAKQKSIVFDYLSPLKPLMEGKYEFYGPNGRRFDAYEFREGKWVYIPDVDARGGKIPVNRPPK